MGGLKEVLDGFEAELELERELGTRVVEIDRSLLQPVDAAYGRQPTGDKPQVASREPQVASRESQADSRQATGDKSQVASRESQAVSRQSTGDKPLDFVFLHHKMLSPGGVAMMAKIVTAMKKTPETAPIVFTGERPKAKVYVVLGGRAMNMWFPELRCSPGQWARGSRGEEVLVTYSPEYILRFGAETAAVKKIKVDMWTSLKCVMRKI